MYKSVLFKGIFLISLLSLFTVSSNAVVNPEKHVKIEVTEQFPEKVTFKLTEDVKAGQLMRIKAGGTQILLKTLIDQATINGEKLQSVQKFSKAQMNRDWTWHIQTLPMATYELKNDYPAGTKVELKMTSAHKNKKINTYSGLSWLMQAGITQEKRALDFFPASEKVIFDFIAGPPSEIKAYVKPRGRLVINYFDKFGNPADSGERKITLEFDGKEINVTKPAGKSEFEVNIPEKIERVKITDDLGLETKSCPKQEGIDGTPVWFGEFHWHNEFSGDGQRPMKDAMHSAKYELALDFAGPADHISRHGKYGRGTVKQQKRICEQFEEPGKFAIVAGAELSCRYGHANFYSPNFDDFTKIAESLKESLKNMNPNTYPHRQLSQLCKENNSIYIPHHSNMDSWVVEGVVNKKDGRPFWCAMPFPERPSDTIVETMRLFEINQSRAAFESEDIQPDWRVLHGGYGGSAQTALMRGYKTGFIAATDNHCGWPTRGEKDTMGITGVYSEKLDQQSIFESLKNRRCYATTGERIVADAKLNGNPMGSIIEMKPGEKRKIDIMIKATAPIEKVQVISLGEVLADLPVEEGKMDFKTTWEDERPGRPLQYVYYYVRARQTDGSCVWMSPWWIELADK